MSQPRSIREVFARNLQALLDYAKDRDMPTGSVRGLEKVTGVSDASIHHYRKATRAIDIVDLAKIGEAYGYPPWDLIRPDFRPDMPPSQIERLNKEELDDLRERVLNALNPRQ